MVNYKTLVDVDLIIAFKDGEILMPMRNMYGQPAIELFKDMHLLHLMNINSKKGIVPLNIDFKRFLCEEVKISVRKLSYIIGKLVEVGYLVKDNRTYSLGDDFKKMFRRRKLKYTLEPYFNQYK